MLLRQCLEVHLHDMNNLPCPAPNSDIDGDGTPDTECGLGDATTEVCNCLIDEIKSGMTFEEYEDLFRPLNPEADWEANCDAWEVMEEAATTCGLSTLPCPSPNSDIDGDGVPDENCGLVFEAPSECRGG